MGKISHGFLGAEVVDVAQGHHVLVPEHVVVRGSAAPYADEGDIQLVAGGVLPPQRAAFQNGESGGGGGGFEQVTSLHRLSLPVRSN